MAAGRRFEANGRWQWFLSLRSLAFGLEKSTACRVADQVWMIMIIYMIRKLNQIIVLSFIQNTSSTLVLMEERTGRGA